MFKRSLLLIAFAASAAACTGAPSEPAPPPVATTPAPAPTPSTPPPAPTMTPTPTPSTAPAPINQPSGATAGDAGAPAVLPTTPASPPPAVGPEDPKQFGCTLVIGIAATGQWFGAGFEKALPNDNWELLAVHSGFIQYWADPNNAVWSKNPSSACAQNPKNPDRVILEGLYLHWMPATVEQWTTVLTETVKTFKAKFSNLKRLELSTFVRAPGAKPCPGGMEFKSYIRPEQDEAYQKIAAMNPGFVTVAPKFEVKSCADYGGNPPHFSGGGASAAAKQIADHYSGVTTDAPK